MTTLPVAVTATNTGGAVASASASIDVQASSSLVYDTVVRSIPAQAKPGYLQSYIDPTYGTKITRITGDPGTTISTGGTWGYVAKHHYSQDQAWNCDQSLILIDTITGVSGGLFLDGSTYAPALAVVNNPTGGIRRWHKTNPSLMLYVSGSDFGQWNVRTGVRTALRTFTGYTGLGFGFSNSNFSDSGIHVSINATRSSDGKAVVFAYDMVSNFKYPDIDPAVIFAGMPSLTAGGALMSSKGNYIAIGNTNDDTKAIDLSGNIITSFPNRQPSHFDTATDANGDEVIVGTGKGSPYNGRCIKARLRDGVTTSIMPAGGYVSHTSCRDTGKSPPWAFCSHELGNAPLYDGEITAPLLDGSRVYRLCHHHNTKVDYDSETHGSASPTGDRVIFVSNWGGASGRPVQTYICDLR